MRTRLLSWLCLTLVSGLFLTSCSEELDFDQADELQVTPTVSSSLLYLETPEDYINGIPVGTFLTELFQFEAFSEDFIANNVLEGTITYEYENTTSKDLQLTVEFLDSAGELLDMEDFLIDAPSGVVSREVLYGMGGKSLDILRNTTQLRLSGANLGDNTSTSTAPEPKFILRSSAAFRLQLQ